eukprot:2894_1
MPEAPFLTMKGHPTSSFAMEFIGIDARENCAGEKWCTVKCTKGYEATRTPWTDWTEYESNLKCRKFGVSLTSGRLPTCHKICDKMPISNDLPAGTANFFQGRHSLVRTSSHFPIKCKSDIFVPKANPGSTTGFLKCNPSGDGWTNPDNFSCVPKGTHPLFYTTFELKNDLISTTFITPPDLSNLKSGTEIACAQDRFLVWPTKSINPPTVDYRVSSTQKLTLAKSNGDSFPGFWNRLKKCVPHPLFYTTSELKTDLKSTNFITPDLSKLKSGTEIACAQDRFCFSIKLFNKRAVDLRVSSTQKLTPAPAKFHGLWNRLKKCDVKHLNGTFWNYTGQVKNGTICHGVGVYSDSGIVAERRPSTYAGEFKDDKIDGFGKRTWVGQNVVFVGMFEDNRRADGPGFLTAEGETRRVDCKG